MAHEETHIPVVHEPNEQAIDAERETIKIARLVGAVDSVNGMQGDVVLTAQDVGALPDDTVIPTTTSELVNDSGFVSAGELARVATTGQYSDLSGTPELAAVATSGAYSDLSGKPVLAAVATSGSYTDLLDTPTLPIVNNATLTIQKNGINVQTFNANSSENKTANITVPTTVASLSDASDYAKKSDVTHDVGVEATARENADIALQEQIDAISASSDVTDIVGTYAELLAYDTTKLKDNDIIKVLQDEHQNDETTYYRWSTSTSSFTLIGEEGPYYTKSQTDTLLNAKQNNLTAGSNVSIAGDIISATDTTYTAGNGLSLSGTEFSADTSILATQSDLSSKQNTLTAGPNISISGDTISATDTTYSAFTGTDGLADGAAGLVPAPVTTDAGKFLKSDGNWSSIPESGLATNTTFWGQTASNGAVQGSMLFNSSSASPAINNSSYIYRNVSGGAESFFLGSRGSTASSSSYVMISPTSVTFKVATGSIYASHADNSPNKIQRVATPTNNNDAANKSYVDTAIATAIANITDYDEESF